MKAIKIALTIALLLSLVQPILAIDYFSYRMNFPDGTSKEHLQTITFTGNLTVIIPSAFTLINYSDNPVINGNNITWNSNTETTINYTISSPASCAEGTIYYSNVYNNNSYVDKFTYVCIPNIKVVDHKVEYGHGCSDYLTENCISNETTTLFNLLRVWNIGNYLTPNEDAINATIVCYYENFPIRTYGRVEINHTSSIIGTYLWELIQGGYWFRIGVLSQDVQKQVGETYGVNCTQLAYQFDHEQVIADFDNYTLNVVSPYPFEVTYQNYSLDPTKYVYTIKNNQSCSVYDIYFNRLIDGYTKTEYFPKLTPNQQISYIGDKIDNNTFTINYVPSWQSNSLCQKMYTQEVKAVVLINHPPNITYKTLNQTISSCFSSSIPFIINYTDIDHDLLTLRWYENGTLKQTETQLYPYPQLNYTFLTDPTTQGNYNITVTVSDSEYTTYYTWNLTVNNTCYCGDGICAPDSCSTCPADCGICPPGCGNGICDGGETCSTCPSDCGTCGNPPSSCFPAGTKILMADGTQKDIEKVNVGDYVTSYDEETKQSTASKVLELETPIRDHMCKIIFSDDSALQLTNEHPVYTNQGWKSINPTETAKENNFLQVSELKIGDQVLSSNSNYKIVKDINCWKQKIQTYNLKTIEKTNTFYAEGILVHNKGGCIINITCGGWQPEECPATGIQTRFCNDKNRCTTKIYNETKECTYILHCLNAKQDYDETGIDCGGKDCPPCGSCFNKIQDEGESGIDCGGTCPPCATCSDGIQNTHILDNGTISPELGVDCGGPCQPCACPTCELPPKKEEPKEICVEPKCESKINSFSIILWFTAILFILIIVEVLFVAVSAHNKKYDNIERIRKIEKSPKLNMTFIVLLFISTFLIWIFDKECYECNAIHVKWILIGLIFIIIAGLLYNLYRIINNIKTDSLRTRSCKALTIAVLLLILITFVRFNYYDCGLATCSDKVINQGEFLTDCGGGLCEQCSVQICNNAMFNQANWLIILLIILFAMILADALYKHYIKRKSKQDRFERIRKSSRIRIFLIFLAMIAIFLTFILNFGCSNHLISPAWIIIGVLSIFIIYTGEIIYLKLTRIKGKIPIRCGYIILAPLIILLLIFSYTYYFGHSAPTCSDGIQNQLENGVDCDGPCKPCVTGCLPLERMPADFCGIPPWQINIIILITIFVGFLIDYIIVLLARWKNKDFSLYDYLKNSQLANVIVGVILLMVLFSTLILDRECFECHHIKSSVILILTIVLIIAFMAYRLYSKNLSSVKIYAKKGIRLLIVLFLVIIISGLLFDFYARCPRSTCSDNIQNQIEQGVDCGGPCPACAEKYINLYVIALLFVLLLLFIIFYGSSVYFKYMQLKKVYNIELCPRCGTHMQRKGWLKAGIQGGKRTVYRCPRCKYRAIRNENEININEKICQDCEIEMNAKDVVLFGNVIGKIYTCPNCKQRRMRIRFFR